MVERTLTKKICAWLADQEKRRGGIWYVKTIGGPYGRRGVPDIIGCVDGLFFGWEVKVPVRGKVSPSQQLELDRITRAGGQSSIVTSLQDAKELLQNLTGEYDQ